MLFVWFVKKKELGFVCSVILVKVDKLHSDLNFCSFYFVFSVAKQDHVELTPLGSDFEGSRSWILSFGIGLWC
jgi:hypothetical protein